MRANTGITRKERKQLVLADFRGVDFSTSPLRVQSNRATEMENFISEYGVNKKRNGWNELHNFSSDEENRRINLVFPFTAGGRDELIVQAGTQFYRIIKKDGKYDFDNPENITNGMKLSDERSQVFFNKGFAYIIGCGEYLVYGSWDDGETYKLERVENVSYVPTTTINIAPNNPEAVIDDETELAKYKAKRETYEDPNLLTRRRINRLIGIKNESKAHVTYTLDANVSNTKVLYFKIDTIRDGALKTIEATCFVDDSVYDTTTYEEIGSIDYDKGMVTIWVDTEPPVEGQSNIEVEFDIPNDKSKEYISCITKCKFGVLFGVNGNSDCLFLSGNPDLPNIDFHSYTDDFTYFPALNSSSMGSDSVPIRGYARLSDGVLATFKAENWQESTVYYRTGVSGVNGSELLGVRDAYFPITAGNIGEGCISSYAFATLVGDHLFLSKNGVFSIVLTENVATAARYAQERSRSVNERLTRHKDLSEAVAIVYKDKYYLAVDDVCYIADARFKYTGEGSIDGAYNYEWWYWTNIPVRVWAVIGNELYFGTPDGRVCKFDEEYTDRTYKSVSVSITPYSGTGDSKDNTIAYDQNDFEVEENDRVTFKTPLYALFLRDAVVEDGRIRIPDEDAMPCFNGIEVYADTVGGSGLLPDTMYEIAETDFADRSFVLYDENKNRVKLSEGGFSLYKKLDGKELFVTNVFYDETYNEREELLEVTPRFQVKESRDDKPLDLITEYNGTFLATSGFSALLTHRANVVAKWYSAIFDLGTNESGKTLLKLTISTEAEINGRLQFGYVTRNIEILLLAKGINVFSFDDLSFENFSFDLGFASSFSVPCKERNFNFIVFRFISDNEYNCAVNTLTAIYKINKANRGVR